MPQSVDDINTYDYRIFLANWVRDSSVFYWIASSDSDSRRVGKRVNTDLELSQYVCVFLSCFHAHTSAFICDRISSCAARVRHFIKNLSHDTRLIL